MAMRDQPLFTVQHDDLNCYRPTTGSAYVYRHSVEPRSDHLSGWRSSAADVRYLSVVEERPFEMDYDAGGETGTVALRSERQLCEFWEKFGAGRAYIDITGFRHHVWAPLLRAAISANIETVVVYVEPAGYRPSITPTEGDFYDLSERIEGISPLPGFASLGRRNERTCFVPLLGFEGPRVSFLLEHVQPRDDRVLPVVGVPGFQPEYPFSAYLANRVPLLETQAWKEVRYATANCPFSLFYALEDVAARFADHVLKIGLVGTKPHAVGAVLYALRYPDRTELVHDHPVRRATRTAGTARLLEYHVTNFLAT